MWPNRCNGQASFTAPSASFSTVFSTNFAASHRWLLRLNQVFIFGPQPGRRFGAEKVVGVRKGIMLTLNKMAKSLWHVSSSVHFKDRRDKFTLVDHSPGTESLHSKKLQVNFDAMNAFIVPKLTQFVRYMEGFVMSKFSWADLAVWVASKTGCSEGSLHRGLLYVSWPVPYYV